MTISIIYQIVSIIKCNENVRLANTMSDIEISQWASGLGLVLVVLSLIAVILSVLRHYIRTFAKEQLEDIRHELKPNGGSSIKDQVTRLEASQKNMSSMHATYIDSQSEKNGRDDLRMDKLEEKIDKIFDILLSKLGK
jgi:Na+-transporting methylmalonyl-CoA/oxaloacetate decarboxylase gamma subunit